MMLRERFLPRVNLLFVNAAKADKRGGADLAGLLDILCQILYANTFAYHTLVVSFRRV